MTYALDTNTITFFLKENKRARQNADAAFDAGHNLIIPKIVDYEVQRGLVAGRMDRKLREYMAFRETVEVGAISDEVWQKAVQVYATLSQQGKPIGDGDVLVAAFCLVNSYTLVTDNTRHFENINGLDIINWKE